jgi:hypothetical protein
VRRCLIVEDGVVGLLDMVSFWTTERTKAMEGDLRALWWFVGIMSSEKGDGGVVSSSSCG